MARHPYHFFTAKRANVRMAKIERGNPSNPRRQLLGHHRRLSNSVSSHVCASPQYDVYFVARTLPSPRSYRTSILICRFSASERLVTRVYIKRETVSRLEIIGSRLESKLVPVPNEVTQYVSSSAPLPESVGYKRRMALDL